MKIKRILYIITFLLGIILIVIGTKTIISNIELFQNAEKKDVIVSNIVQTPSSEKEIYTTYIEYEIEGNKYEEVLLKELPFYKEKGTTITIYYNKENPKEFLSLNFIIIIGVITIIGLILTISSLKKIIKSFNMTRSKKYLKKTGQLFEADIIRISKVDDAAIIECTVVMNGLIKSFQSEKIWFNALGIYNVLGIRKINVYINPENILEYYVDVEEYKKYLDKVIK